MDRCDICEKEIKKESTVWYSSNMPETILCWSHYLKWCKHHKPYINSHKTIKPLTKAWNKMCDEEAKLFMKWLEQQVKDANPDNSEVKRNED